MDRQAYRLDTADQDQWRSSPGDGQYRLDGGPTLVSGGRNRGR